MLVLVRFAFLALVLFASPVLASDAEDLANRLEEKANTGDATAAYKLGLLFSQGKKLAPDLYTAAEWFEVAAKRGHMRGMLKIAAMYEEGQGVSKDIEKAFGWYEKAAAKGSTDAMLALGNMFVGVDDFEGAASWYIEAAVKGNQEAMLKMGSYLYKGKGLRFDLRQAFAWLELAAQKGSREAKALQYQIIGEKGQQWADGVRQRVNNRQMPEAYWNAR